ncbi:hypothetical protein CPT_Muldoon_098 [Serratia phage Muldoon]|uniref:Uncharacterized protein n=1 Tax=Serratia phage Muldoon TaxID=2601678 RepID=A0A5P8PH90_9CAUD|nr:hypothetical protein HYP94_gp097 [Serratia phage Muldoon]QFR56053.1 hypothetical protein CPT_Muldoon_098 [Serratia phage Muldoon]
MKHVTLEDIKPGAEFYVVYCPKGQNPFVGKNTVVINSFPTYWSPGANGNYPDNGDHSYVNISTLVDGKLETSCVSLRDRHIIRNDVAANMSYNLTRWFHTPADADAFADSIKKGELDHPADQAFYDKMSYLSSLVE